MAEAIVSIVVGRLTDLLIEDAQVLEGVKDEIQQVLTELRRMKTFLRDADSRISEEEVRVLLLEIRELAYDAEHVVESFLVKTTLSPGKIIQWMSTRKFSRKIKYIQRKMSLLFNRFHDCKIMSTLESPESSNSIHGTGTTGKLKRFHTFTIVEPEIFVGFQEDVDRLVAHLVDEGDGSYPLISICGMGGLGKTTLAEKIYNHSTIKAYFAGLAWVSISQKWQTKQLLQRLIICLLHEKKEEILTWDDDKLVENLLQIQQKKKCLIVLDDIWSTAAWDSIKRAFTAENSISKLMLTSRKVDVAAYVNSKGLIHRPEFLSEDQSWNLLKSKALPSRGDALDITRDVKRMEELGRDMVRNCGGLPLAIVTLGGVLVTKPSLIEWEKVHGDITSSLKKGKGLGQDYQSQIFHVLGWSYMDLPLQLKPCFLYLGKFMEDEWIDAENLYQLWIAEGMVLSSDKREGETMMQVAESYMAELVHRSMVQVRFDNLESLSTKFRSCSLHDLMRDLSVSQAKAEDFYEAIDLREENDFHLNHSVVSPHANTRQLVVYYRSEEDISYFTKKPNHQQYRSVLLINVVEYYNICRPQRLGSYLVNFKLLRVLALENTACVSASVLGTLSGTNMGRVLGSLVYLRYLSLRRSDLETFPWVHKLVMLQTLYLNVQSIDKSPVSSNVLGKLAHLRHLCLPDFPDWQNYADSWKNFKLRFDGLRKLERLENFNTRWCNVKDLPKLSSLRRLKLKAVGDYDEVKQMFNYLSGLALSSNSCLQYLALEIKIYFHPGLINGSDMIRQLLCNHKFNLNELSLLGPLPELSEILIHNHTHSDISLIGITSLKLAIALLKDDPMPVLEKIPTLRDLSFGLMSYLGKEMVCSATGFPKLARLELYRLDNLEKWRVEKGSMPILQRLEIDDCLKLEEIPQGFIYLTSLRELILTKVCKLHDRVNGEQAPDFYKVAHVPRLSYHTRFT